MPTPRLHVATGTAAVDHTYDYQALPVEPAQGEGDSTLAPYVATPESIAWLAMAQCTAFCGIPTASPAAAHLFEPKCNHSLAHEASPAAAPRLCRSRYGTSTVIAPRGVEADNRKPRRLQSDETLSSKPRSVTWKAAIGKVVSQSDDFKDYGSHFGQA